MMRYLRALADKDIALDRSMIPLGSCTMKLNAAAEMEPITWPEFSRQHPFAPASDTPGLRKLIADLETLADRDHRVRRGVAAAQRRFAGRVRGPAGDPATTTPPAATTDRDVCLIPSSAHGTNAASAALAGMRVVVVACRENGDVDLDDLRAKVAEHAERLSAIMITYPSTHGVYEHDIAEICAAVHDAGGQVYVDGANLNALVGLARPGRFGGDVSHLNLHKTFCIPHGGGGPGVGPVAVRAHLAQFLPGHPLADELPDGPSGVGGAVRVGVDPADHLGLHPDDGRSRAARGVADRDRVGQLRRPPPRRVLPGAVHGRERHGRPRVHPGPARHHQGHRRHRRRCGKAVGGLRFPRADHELPGGGHADGRADGKREPGRGRRVLRGDDRDPRRDRPGRVGQWPVDDNPLRGAPHTAECLLVADWEHPYTREQAAYPLGKHFRPKVWPPVRRIDGAYGDRNLVCSCPPVEAFA